MRLTIDVENAEQAHVIIDALQYEADDAEETGHEESAAVLQSTVNNLVKQVNDATE
jgi:hypothetical protein